MPSRSVTFGTPFEEGTSGRRLANVPPFLGPEAEPDELRSVISSLEHLNYPTGPTKVFASIGGSLTGDSSIPTSCLCSHRLPIAWLRRKRARSRESDFTTWSMVSGATRAWLTQDGLWPAAWARLDLVQWSPPSNHFRPCWAASSDTRVGERSQSPGR